MDERHRILVTGATGFLGSHVVRTLLSRGCEVAVLLRSTSDVWRIANVLPHVHQATGDLTALADARADIHAFGPHATVHLAWQGVGNRRHDDRAQYENVQATCELVRCVSAGGCRTFIGVGSQAEYGPHAGAMDESAATQPRTMYGAAKLAACNLAQQACSQTGMRFAWLRLFSCYGPMDHAEWLLPYVITQLLRGQAVALTPGEQRWDYLYARDAAAAIADVIDTPAASGIFNVGSGSVRTIREIVEAVRDMIAPAAPLDFGARAYERDQVMHLQANIARLRDLTGWSPRVELEEGLARTIAWYRQAEPVAVR